MKLILSSHSQASMIQPAWLTTLCALLETSVPALPISKITKATKTVTLRSVSETQAIRQEVAQRCDALQIDHAFIADDLKLSDFKLVAMDMDSTFITIECIDEIADLCGLKAEVSAITEATMRGEIKDFSESLQRRVALLKGLNASALQQVYDERLKLSPGAEAMLRAVQKAGLKTLLVSGGFTFFTERLQERCGLDFAHANTLEIVAGKLTGKVIGDIVDAQEKAHAVQRVCDWLDVPTTQAIVIGDGANDLKMMALAGMSIAYHAKPVVRAQTSQAIHHGGLDVLLDWLPE